MEKFLKLPFQIALLIIGAILLLISILGGFPKPNGYNFVVQNSWSRMGLLLVGIPMIGLSIYVEFRSKSNSQKKSNATNISDACLQAEKFFYTLDDRAAANFLNLTKDAHQISISARTAVNLLSQYQKVFEQLGKTGCKIRLLFIDPNCEVAQYVYGNAAEVYRHNVQTMAIHLKSVRAKAGNNLEVKTTNHAPTMSMIIIEKQSKLDSFARVQLYFLHSCVGRDRPVFDVNSSDKWYNTFVDEFNQIWESSTPWSDLKTSNILDRRK